VNCSEVIKCFNFCKGKIMETEENLDLEIHKETTSPNQDNENIVHLPFDECILSWILEYAAARDLRKVIQAIKEYMDAAKKDSFRKIIENNLKLNRRIMLTTIVGVVENEQLHEALPAHVVIYQEVVPKDIPQYWEMLSQLKAHAILYYVRLKKPMDIDGFRQAIQVLTEDCQQGDEAIKIDMERLYSLINDFSSDTVSCRGQIKEILSKYNLRHFQKVFRKFVEKIQLSTPTFLDTTRMDYQKAIYVPSTEAIDMINAKDLERSFEGSTETYQSIWEQKDAEVKDLLSGGHIRSSSSAIPKGRKTRNTSTTTNRNVMKTSSDHPSAKVSSKNGITVEEPSSSTRKIDEKLFEDIMEDSKEDSSEVEEELSTRKTSIPKVIRQLRDSVNKLRQSNEGCDPITAVLQTNPKPKRHSVAALPLRKRTLTQRIGLKPLHSSHELEKREAIVLNEEEEEGKRKDKEQNRKTKDKGVGKRKSTEEYSEDFAVLPRSQKRRSHSLLERTSSARRVKWSQSEEEEEEKEEETEVEEEETEVEEEIDTKRKKEKALYANVMKVSDKENRLRKKTPKNFLKNNDDNDSNEEEAKFVLPYPNGYRSPKRTKTSPTDSLEALDEDFSKMSSSLFQKDKRKKNTGGRRKTRFFTDAEIDNLYRGVARFGFGKWKQILKTYDFGDREAIDLKDKWRNLERNNPDFQKRYEKEIESLRKQHRL